VHCGLASSRAHLSGTANSGWWSNLEKQGSCPTPMALPAASADFSCSRRRGGSLTVDRALLWWGESILWRRGVDKLTRTATHNDGTRAQGASSGQWWRLECQRVARSQCGPRGIDDGAGGGRRCTVHGYALGEETTDGAEWHRGSPWRGAGGSCQGTALRGEADDSRVATPMA
jgi:hypothetical protein